MLGAAEPAPVYPPGMLTVVGWARFEPWFASSALKSPLRWAAVGVTARLEPKSMLWRWTSMPRKKKALSRFLLKSVPGMRIGPLRLPPG